MADWNFSDSSRYVSAGTANLSAGGSITTGAANTKGAYRQIAESIPFDTDEIYLKTKVHLVQPFQRYFLYDVAAGTPGAEVNILQNIPLSPIDGQYGHMLRLPKSLPAGTSISCRAQSSGAGAILMASLVLGMSGLASSAPYGNMKSYGGNTADSRSTIIPPGGTPTAKGVWTQLSPLVESDIAAVTIVTNDETNTVGLATQNFLLDIGVGPSGQERIVIPDLYIVSGANSSKLTPETIGPLPVSIPRGSRLVARAQCNNGNQLQNLIGIVIIAHSY